MTHRFVIAAATGSAMMFCAAAPAMAQGEGSSPWTGWYVGANIGGAWGDNSLGVTATPGPPRATLPIAIPPADAALLSGGNSNNNKTGFVGGIEGGYNWQYGNWLFGIESEFSALDINESQTNTAQSTTLTGPGATPVTYAITQRAKTNWMWTLRPRIGYVSGPWLVYGTAGLATADIKASLNYSDTLSPPNSIHSEDSSTKTGWTAGLGAGYAFTPQWSVKGEWLYADFGSISTTATAPSGFVALTTHAKVRSNIVRMGVDYRF